jgi:hypothetical protein
MTNKTWCAIALGFIILGGQSASAQSFKVCIGEFEANCPGGKPGHDQFIGCRDSKPWAEQACKVQGSDKPAQYQIIPGNGVPGNQCGYRVDTVICR